MLDDDQWETLEDTGEAIMAPCFIPLLAPKQRRTLPESDFVIRSTHEQLLTSLREGGLFDSPGHGGK